MNAIVLNAVSRTVEHQTLTGTRAVLDFFPNGISFCGHLPSGDAVYIDR